MSDDIATLKAENAALKNTIENINLEKMSLEQTVIELLRDKIGLKTTIAQYEKAYQKVNAELTARTNEVTELKKDVEKLVIKIQEYQAKEVELADAA